MDIRGTGNQVVDIRRTGNQDVDIRISEYQVAGYQGNRGTGREIKNQNGKCKNDEIAAVPYRKVSICSSQ